MPLCQKCRKFFPPQFCNEVDTNEYLCEWCLRDIDSITVKRDGGQEYKYTREQCAKEYEQFIKQLKETEDVKKLLGKE